MTNIINAHHRFTREPRREKLKLAFKPPPPKPDDNPPAAA